LNWYRKRIEKLNCEEDNVRGGLIALTLTQGFHGMNRYGERIEMLDYTSDGNVDIKFTRELTLTEGLQLSVSMCYMLLKSNSGFLVTWFPPPADTYS